jgi:YebC/PmpR family DNA-binding regulatory protein
MSGHSKWSKIKRKKAATDGKRSKMMSKMIREITVAARDGGGDPDTNPRLRTAVSNSRAENITNETIQRAVLRGSGGLEGVTFVECVYEGYAPNGVALYIEAATDNRNRSTAEIRHALVKHGGSLAEKNSVAWLFERKGSVLVTREGADADELMMLALDAGAEDILDEDDEAFEVMTTPETFDAVRASIEENGFGIISANLQMLPKTTVPLEADAAPAVLKVLDVLEDLDDVSNVYANFDMDESVMASFEDTAA